MDSAPSKPLMRQISCGAEMGTREPPKIVPFLVLGLSHPIGLWTACKFYTDLIWPIRFVTLSILHTYDVPCWHKLSLKQLTLYSDSSVFINVTIDIHVGVRFILDCVSLPYLRVSSQLTRVTQQPWPGSMFPGSIPILCVFMVLISKKSFQRKEPDFFPFQPQFEFNLVSFI